MKATVQPLAVQMLKAVQELHDLQLGSNWEFPKMRGPNMDPKQRGSSCKDTRKKVPPMHRNSQLETLCSSGACEESSASRGAPREPYGLNKEYGLN